MSTPASYTSFRYEVRVLDVTVETPDAVTISMGPPDGFSYTAGQYITVFFDDTDVPEGKAYSLSSCPSDPHLSITVKRVGLFSGKLHALKPDDMLAISPAYGMFNAFGSAPLVALAAGIGIAPIYSILRNEASRQTGREIHLFYSNTRDESIIFRDSLNQLAASAPNIHIHHVITRQPTSGYAGKRLDGQQIAQDFPGFTAAICGTVDFVRDMRGQVIRGGIHEDDIITETFFERSV